MGFRNWRDEYEDYEDYEEGARMTILVTRRHQINVDSAEDAKKLCDSIIITDSETLPDDAEVADCYIDDDSETKNNSKSFECVIVYEIVREAYEKDGEWYAKDEDDLPEDCEFKRVVDSRGQILCEWL